MHHRNTALIITSALFAGRQGEMGDHPDAFRLQRLSETLASVEALGFGKIIVLDATLGEGFQLPFQNVLLHHAGRTLQPAPQEFAMYGPSRLEIDLMHNSSAFLQEQLAGFSRVVKLSAGYQVSNLKQILECTTEGLVFRFGNPLRRQIRFCLSSFYILPVPVLFRFIDYATGKLPQVHRTYPLEAVLYDFLPSVKRTALAMAYPQLKAVFLSGGSHSGQFSFKCKLYIYGVLARMGWYASAVQHG